MVISGGMAVGTLGRYFDVQYTDLAGTEIQV